MKPKGAAYVNLVMDDEAGGGSAGGRPDQPDAARRFEGHPHDLEATMARRRHNTWCWFCAVPKRSSMAEERWVTMRRYHPCDHNQTRRPAVRVF
mmetsp:Transcript_34834/g.93008  ORF Transcript_34834/g.93008 Transcript_34834/m.93008 type:complete len:94 (+) Transcript_34834:67-348(+)